MSRLRKNQERKQRTILEGEYNFGVSQQVMRDNLESDLGKLDSLTRKLNYILQAVGVPQSNGGLIPTYT